MLRATPGQHNVRHRRLGVDAKAEDAPKLA